MTTIQSPKIPNPRNIEKVYWELLSIANGLNEHQFSKNITKRDMQAVYKAINSIAVAADLLFITTHEDKERS